MEMTKGLNRFQNTLFSSQAFELRRNYLNVLCIGALIILTFAILRSAAWRFAPGLFHTWQVAATMAAGLLTTSILQKRDVRLASWLFIIISIITTSVEFLLFPHGMALFLFAAIGVMAALLHSERGAAVLIGLNLACILALGVSHATLLTTQEVIWPMLITLLVSAAAWLGTHQLYTVLQWEWHSTQQSLSAAREAQDHRAELMHLNKELDGAYLRLERMNRMLVLARKEAEEATALKMQFANTVSHELRSPINMILGFSDMMVNSPEVYGAQMWDPRLQNHIQHIYQSSQHLSQLIDDVLDMARIDAYRLSLVKASARIDDVIAETCEIARTLFDARHLFLRTQIEPNLPSVLLDQTRIRQVLLNLLTNAVRFTQQGGVTIRAFLSHAGALPPTETTTTPAETSIVIGVTDTGTGIDAQDIPRLFQQFGQLENVYRWSRGAGLGLFISRQLIELHGGHIWAESDLDAGTTFFISLPLQTADSSDTSTLSLHQQDDVFWRGLEARARERRALLIVGDDPKIKRMLTTELSTYDVSWLPADVSTEVLQHAVSDVHPCAVLRVTDECIEAESIGSETVSGIPLIVCRLPGLFQVATPRYLSDYLVKPVSRRKLADALARREADATPLRRLLIIDDDVAMREYLRLTIDHVLGKDVALYEASDGATALSIIQQHKPDTVLLDLNLPDIDGFELAERIHAECSDDIHILAVTARDLQADLCGDQQDVITCLRSKPFSRRELGKILDGMIDGFSANVVFHPVQQSSHVTVPVI